MEKLSNSYYSISLYLNELVNVVTIVVFIPLFNHVALPFLPILSMSLKFRMIIGLVLNLIAALIAVFLQITVEIDRNDSGNDKFIWLLLPAIIFSVAETLTIVSCKFPCVLKCMCMHALLPESLNNKASACTAHRSTGSTVLHTK